MQYVYSWVDEYKEDWQDRLVLDSRAEKRLEKVLKRDCCYAELWLSCTKTTIVGVIAMGQNLNRTCSKLVGFQAV